VKTFLPITSSIDLWSVWEFCEMTELLTLVLTYSVSSIFLVIREKYWINYRTIIHNIIIIIIIIIIICNLTLQYAVAWIYKIKHYSLCT
jgi:hypothetical protein